MRPLLLAASLYLIGASLAAHADPSSSVAVEEFSVEDSMPTRTLLCGAIEGATAVGELFSYRWSEEASTGLFATKEKCEAEKRRPQDRVCETALARLLTLPKELEKLRGALLEECDKVAKAKQAELYSCAIGASVNGKMCDPERSMPGWHCVHDIGIRCEPDGDQELKPTLIRGRGTRCEEVRPTFPEQSPLSGGYQLHVACESIVDLRVKKSGTYGCTDCPTK